MVQVVVNPTDVTLVYGMDEWSRPACFAVDKKGRTLATFNVVIYGPGQDQRQLQMKDERTGLVLSVEVAEIEGNDFQIVLEKFLNEVSLSHINYH
jgi:hypothetical protein